MKKLAKTLLTLSCVLSTTLFVMMFVFNDIIVEQVGIPTSMSFASMFGIVSVGTMLMRALHDEHNVDCDKVIFVIVNIMIV